MDNLPFYSTVVQKEEDPGSIFEHQREGQFWYKVYTGIGYTKQDEI